jgi:hypothetical protein
MKTEIEKRAKNRCGNKLLDRVAECCRIATNEDDLRERLKKANIPNNSEDYRYGFGHHHFWFSEWDGQTWNRLIITKF